MEVSGQFHAPEKDHQMGESLASVNAKAKKEPGKESNPDCPVFSLVTVLVGLYSIIMTLRRTVK
jgi:hypothetical protein